MFRLAFAIGIGMWPSIADAQFVDGNKLYEYCQQDHPLCWGYIYGVADVATRSAGIASVQFSMCAPIGVSGQQVHDVVMRYFEQNPQYRNAPASYLIIDALSTAWPCTQ